MKKKNKTKLLSFLVLGVSGTVLASAISLNIKTNDLNIIKNKNESLKIDKNKPSVYIVRNNQEKAFETLDEAIKSANDNEVIFLNKNIKLKNTINIDKNITISAKSVINITREQADNSFDMFNIKENKQLNFNIDNLQTSKIYINGQNIELNGSAVFINVEKGGKLTASKGVLFANAKALKSNSGVFKNKGHIVLNGSEIANNIASSSTIIENFENAIFEINGSKIHNNIALDKNLISNKGIIHFNSGNITNNNAYKASFINNLNDGKFYFNDGEFLKNKANNDILFENENKSQLILGENATFKFYDANKIVLKNISTIKIKGSLSKFLNNNIPDKAIDILLKGPEHRFWNTQNVIYFENFNNEKEKIFDFFVLKNLEQTKTLPLFFDKSSNSYRMWKDANLFSEFYKYYLKTFQTLYESDEFETIDDWNEKVFEQYFDKQSIFLRLLTSKITQYSNSNHDRNWLKFLDFESVFDLFQDNDQINKFIDELIKKINQNGDNEILEFAYLNSKEFKNSIQHYQLNEQHSLTPISILLKNHEVSRIGNALFNHIDQYPYYNNTNLDISNQNFINQAKRYLKRTEVEKLLYGQKTSYKIDNDINLAYSKPENWKNQPNNLTQNTKVEAKGIFVQSSSSIVEYESLEQAIKNANDNDVIWINENIELENTIIINKKLNFKSFYKINISKKRTNQEFNMFEIFDNGDLTVSIDDLNNQSITFNGMGVENNNALIFLIKTKGKLETKKGVYFVGSRAKNSYFSVFRNYGHLVVDGSIISDNSSASASVLRNEKGAKFEFKDGLISNNFASKNVSIIYSEGDISISGGTIVNNNADGEGLIWVAKNATFTFSGGKILSNKNADSNAIHLFENAKLILSNDAYISQNFGQHIALNNNSIVEIKNKLNHHFKAGVYDLNILLNDFEWAKDVIKLGDTKLAESVADHIKVIDGKELKLILLEPKKFEPFLRTISEPMYQELKNVVNLNYEKISGYIENNQKNDLINFIKKLNGLVSDEFIISQLIKHNPKNLVVYDQGISSLIKTSNKTIEDFANDLWTLSERAFIFAGLATGMTIGWGVTAFFTGGSTTVSAVASGIQAVTLFTRAGIIRNQYNQLVNSSEWEKVKNISYQTLKSKGLDGINIGSKASSLLHKIVAIYRAIKIANNLISTISTTTSWAAPGTNFLLTMFDLVISTASFMDGIAY
ncbi:hypothetical protein [[Mycoplasma] collis]|uniref:hypothetical protein n=1 Tax=[Mycoplasma] collis TaxID=2127 RepID=UPI00051C7B2F|nr:hypothetical protein [[Mycoplasma] collis]